MRTSQRKPNNKLNHCRSCMPPYTSVQFHTLTEDGEPDFVRCEFTSTVNHADDINGFFLNIVGQITGQHAVEHRLGRHPLVSKYSNLIEHIRKECALTLNSGLNGTVVLGSGQPLLNFNGSIVCLVVALRD